MYHLWRGLDGAAGAAAGVSAAWAMGQVPGVANLRNWDISSPRPVSTSQKKIAATTTMMNTITEVIQVSLRLVQVILRISARTSWKNCTGLVRFFGAGAEAARAEAG